MFDSMPHQNQAPIGWNTYPNSNATCIDAHIREAVFNNVKKSIIVLELYVKELDITLTRFFNCKKNRSGHYSVPRDSDFAKLYRLTTGEYPAQRFSKVEQLIKHILGSEFNCSYKDAESEKFGRYYKVTKINPIEPIITKAWHPSGKLVRKAPNKKNIEYKTNEETKRKLLGSEVENNRQHTGKKEETSTLHRSIYTNGLDANPIPLSHLENKTNKVEAYSITQTTIGHGNDGFIRKRSNKEKIFIYHRLEQETYDEYLDRVLDASFM